MTKIRGHLVLDGRAIPATLRVRKYRAAPDYDPDVSWHFIWELRAYYSAQKTNIQSVITSRNSHDLFINAVREAKLYGFVPRPRDLPEGAIL